MCKMDFVLCYCISVSVEATLLQQLLALPVELWATPCAELFLWTFKCMRRSDAVGTLLVT